MPSQSSSIDRDGRRRAGRSETGQVLVGLADKRHPEIRRRGSCSTFPEARATRSQPDLAPENTEAAEQGTHSPESQDLWRRIRSVRKN